MLRLALLLALLATPAWAQDESADIPAAEQPQPSMQDVLNSLEQAPANNATETTPAAAEEAPAPNSYIVPPANQTEQAVPSGTMIPDAATTQPAPNSSIVPAQPLENMNPALMPQTPADEAPKAVRAETPPTPPKPPAYEAQPYITLQTLDKVTARTETLTVKVGDTVAIGPLFVQVKTCQKAAPLETPDSAAFLEIWEAKPKDSMAASKDNGPSQWVFSGWMFASSPALSAMDHPIYDIWVLNCKNSAKDEAEKSDIKKDDAVAEKPADKPKSESKAD